MPNAKKKTTAPQAGVRIRMYRPGLGDCFLLTFSSGAKQEHVLIDCGVFTGTEGQKEILNRIAAHVRETTGNRVSALVATHEHWDHVAGFHYAKPEFDQLSVDSVWSAWTEDPDQTIATENKQKTKALALAVQTAAMRLRASGSPHDRECALAVDKVLEFSGALGAAAFSKLSDTAMGYVTSRRKAKDRYLAPGDVLYRPDWVPGGVRIYVLAPPMDRAALRQDRTPVEEGYKDEKPKHKQGAALAWTSAVLGEDDTQRPFDLSLAWPEPDVLSARQAHPIGKLGRRYRAEPWRRIDNDWLQSAATLALQLDNSINNTSLVLAFELVASGRVLLFVGDSELESWKSWQGRAFQVKDGAEKKTVTARDLLARTVFYKVGHHGSGNATLRAGLEAMTHADLVAAVPTDQKFAKDKQGWDMPAAKLAPALSAQARGRVLYADPGRTAIREDNPKGISAASWQQFTDAVKGGGKNDLFVEYHVEA